MPAPLRIAFVLPSFAGGGAQKVLVTLAAGLDRSRFAPFFVVFEPSGPWRSLVPEGMRLISLEKPSLRSALPHLAWTLRRERPDAVVSTLAYLNAGMLMIRWAFRAHTRVIVREANSTRHHTNSGLGRWAYRFAYRVLYRLADCIICPATYLVDELTQDYGLPRERLALVLNPLDEAPLRTAAAPPRRRAGEGRRFIAVGRLIEQKNYGALLDDFAQLPTDSHLTIFGDGEKRAELEAQIGRLELAGRVALAGFEPQPAPWVAGADALLLPSRWEGMPNVALEALACGTPVIAAPEAGGIGDIAAHARPGAVTLAPTGRPFIDAMLAVMPQRDAVLRPSLLPDIFRVEHAVATFSSLLVK